MDRDVFTTDRPLLFSIAYRMLGSATDAEDILQDAWLRYHGADRSTIRSPKAFATTIVTRLCLDRLKSARTTREEYIGPWLPEPVLTSEIEGPDTVLQRTESVTLAFLVLLEKLSPEERAVFLLKDVFEYRPLGDRRNARHDRGKLAPVAASGEGATGGRAAAADRHVAVEARDCGALRPRVSRPATAPS